MRPGICWFIGAFALLFAGCGDEHVPDQHAQQRSGIIASAQPNWLDATSDIEPAVWLIAREKDAGGNNGADDEVALRRSLVAIAALYKDDPRMIANRAVQIEIMLDPSDGRESAIWLINNLGKVITEPGRIEGFGALGQQYYNMRKAGLSEQDALADLSRRYKPHG